MAKNYVIIVGGGSGTRMQSDTPKQFMLLNGLPILMHTIKKFNVSQTSPVIILVLAPTLRKQWQQLCEEYTFTIQHIVVDGGSTRFHSVLNGLKYIKSNTASIENGYIAIHDGVRPMVSGKIIDDGFEQVVKFRALVTATASKDSIRIKEIGDITRSIDRNTVFLVQTPQFFAAELLLKAYEQPFEAKFTDDASVVENFGYPIKIMQGDTRNIKITFPEDLILAEILTKSL